MPIFALPVAASLFTTVADRVPKLDVTPSCRGAVAARVFTENIDAMKNCLEIEGRARDQLVTEWLKFAPADRAKCLGAVMSFSPTYTELLTCLEFAQELRKASTNRQN